MFVGRSELCAQGFITRLGMKYPWLETVKDDDGREVVMFDDLQGVKARARNRTVGAAREETVSSKVISAVTTK